MKAEEAVVRGLLGGILLFLTFITASVLHSAGVQAHVITLWCIIVLLFGISAGGLLGMVPKHWSRNLFFTAIACVFLAIILQLRIIPICGDDICSAGECSRCAKDCSPSECVNGACELAVEHCGTSADCACSASNACSPGRNSSDAKGCAPIRCGDNFCDAGEGPSNCCTDCGCNPGYSCDQNICFFEVPKVSFATYRYTATVSAATLAGNPLLTDANSNAHPMMTLVIRSSKSIEEVSATFVIPAILSNTVPLGTLYAEQEKELQWYVQPDARLLQVIDDRNTEVIVFVNYTDAVGNDYSMNRSFPLTLLSRNTLDQYGHVVLFVQEVETAAQTAESIWDELGTQVIVQHRPGTKIQFPDETLARGSGDPRDIAVLLASAYHTAGLRTFIVESSDGFFVRVWHKDRFVMLDPSLFESSFEDAISFNPGYGVYDIDRVRTARNFTAIELS